MPVEKKNIFLSGTIETLPFTSKSNPGSDRIIPGRDPAQHANFLRRRFAEVYAQNRALTPQQVAAIRYKEGVYLEFSGKQNCDLVVKSLENIRAGIRLLNVRIDQIDDTIKATVYVPEGKETFFINRLEQYSSTATIQDKPKHENLINSIEDVKLALLESFWVGERNDIPTENPVWCEVWLRIDDNQYERTEASFSELCTLISIDCDDKAIRFPERLVKLIYANAAQLGELIKRFEYIAEIRRAAEVTSFLYDLTPHEQRQWVDDLMSRLEFDPSDSSVCIIDTGVNHGHPLLSNAYNESSIHTVEKTWGENDHDGHGTEMAGIALLYNLQEKLITGNTVRVIHRLESVKILPVTGENDPKLYGALTQNAVYIAEAAQPQYKRAICMAVTSAKYNTNDGSPTSWSGAIDSLVSGATGDDEKHLFFVSAGNVYPQELAEAGYPTANITHSIESPGQAWNAITVGAHSNTIQINDPSMQDYQAVADSGELSPFSSTSMMWDKKWPIKPEILCDGGNVASDGTIYTECTDLSLLTTYYRPMDRLFGSISGTSSATAQAAWMAAQILAEYPQIWPETVRALLIHSSRWTEKMKAQFGVPDQKSTGRRNLLRTCGYGVPSLDRAIQCLNNRVNLIVEGDLQPFVHGGMNEMHIHKIPWPREVLQGLGVVPVEMRVTLSYFIEPGPGEIGWKDKYRYPSCGLRFDIINQNETRHDFVKRVNVKMRGDDRKDSGEGTSGSENWYLGVDNRDVGSIHSDFKEQNAVDLCEANYIAVYPVIGWWRERAYLKCYNKRVRYSLVVSISTPQINIDLYTPIITQIETEIQTLVEITI